MPKGKKTGGRDFVKGDPRAGRPRTPPDIRQANLLTKAEVMAKLGEFLKLDVAELQRILEDKSNTVMDHWIGRIALMGIKGGDDRRLNFMFDRLIGKVTDKIEHTLPQDIVIERMSGEQTIITSKKEE